MLNCRVNRDCVDVKPVILFFIIKFIVLDNGSLSLIDTDCQRCSYTLCVLCTQVSQWYELVVFTASMEIYGSAVADKLDNNRNILKRRYYRQVLHQAVLSADIDYLSSSPIMSLLSCVFWQHCTLDLGSYIKDLSVVHDDLSSIVILDNSPGAYRSHPGKTHGFLHIQFILHHIKHTTHSQTWMSTVPLHSGYMLSLGKGRMNKNEHRVSCLCYYDLCHLQILWGEQGEGLISSPILVLALA